MTPEQKILKRERRKRWLAKNPGYLTRYNKQWRKDHPGAAVEAKKKYLEKNPGMAEKFVDNKHRNLLMRMCERYGSSCAVCGHVEPRDLCFDHVNKDGGEHRRGLTSDSGYSSWRDMLKHPEYEVQTLCKNCHAIKSSIERNVTDPSRISQRQLVLKGYGCKCSVCGYDKDERALELDHVTPIGGKNRAKNSVSPYRDAINRGFPSDYRVLCAICNHNAWAATFKARYRKTKVGATNPFHRYLTDDQLNVPPDDWAKLKANHTQEEIVNHLSCLVDCGLSFLPLVTAEEAAEAFVTLMQWRPAWGETDDLGRLVIPRSSHGSLASDFFHRKNRAGALLNNAESSANALWEDSERRRAIIRKLWTWGASEGVTNKNFHRYMTMYAGMPHQFRPSSAKALYEKYAATRVLDCCAGWGDRLAAFYATDSAKLYVGIDPNEVLHEAYRQQVGLYGRYSCGKTCEFINKPIEDVGVADCGRFDFSFTSPPYFNTERYADSQTQSWKRYGNIAAWVDGFLRPFLLFQATLVDGPICVNIAPCGRLDLPYLTIKTAETVGLELVETLSLRISNRAGGGNRYEPVLIFKK